MKEVEQLVWHDGPQVIVTEDGDKKFIFCAINYEDARDMVYPMYGCQLPEDVIVGVKSGDVDLREAMDGAIDGVYYFMDLDTMEAESCTEKNEELLPLYGILLKP